MSNLAADNITHWDSYYGEGMAPPSPSTFFEYCLATVELPKKGLVLEAGCGNGRDSMGWARHGFPVIGVDISPGAIAHAQSHISAIPDGGVEPKFTVGSFADLSSWASSDEPVNGVYSRFTLHSVGAKEGESFIKSAFDVLAPGGVLMVEARSVKSDMFGKGTPAPDGDPDAWVYGPDHCAGKAHYRRFIRKSSLLKSVLEAGFELEQVFEGKGVAVYKDDDPVVVRVIASKPVA